ncbi:MAG: hypothetical protein R2700_11785 [Solirubrobacterales bacterium]
MSDHTILRAADAFWRESNQMKVLNTDLGKQLELANLGARLWRLRPRASTLHRHFEQEELYVLLEGTGRMRIEDEEPLTLAPLDAIRAGPRRRPGGSSSTTPRRTPYGWWSALRGS